MSLVLVNNLNIRTRPSFTAEKVGQFQAKDLIEWQDKACALLPNDFKQNKQFLTELSNLVARYEITSTEQGDNS